MRIESGVGRTGAGGPAARSVAGGARFALPTDARPASTGGPAMVAASHGVDILLALQTVDVAGERRRRNIQRGRSLLDALDRLKLELVTGEADAAALGRLRALIAEARLPTGDAGLDDLLAAVELRAEVEIAKRAAASGG